MVRIFKRSNKTRAIERPPLLCANVSAALLEDVSRLAVKRADAKDALTRKSKRDQERKKKVEPANAVQQAALPEQKPADRKPPAAQVDNRPAASPPKAATQLPAHVQPPAAQMPAARQQEETPRSSSTQANDSQVKKTPDEDPAARPKTQVPSASNGAPSIRVPGSGAPSANRPDAGPANAGNGNVIQKPSSPSPASKTPGTNGMAARSLFYRSEGFSSVPAARIPPAGDSSSKQRPVQIPMEIPLQPKDGNNNRGVPPNGKPPSAVEPARPADSANPPTQVGKSTLDQPASQIPPRPLEQPAHPYQGGLEAMLKQHPDLPAQAAVLGVCEDGLPVLLDLHDPAPGALLVIGDEREEQLNMLRTAVASVVKRGSPRDVQFVVLSCDPKAWQNWVAEQGFSRHCLAVENADSENVREWVLRLADWTEQRRLGQRSGPPIMLVMDTLSFLLRLTYDVRLNFEWMAKEGPQAEIWPVAAVSTELAKALNSRRMLRSFQMRVFGYTPDTGSYVLLSSMDDQAASTFGRPGEFAVQVGERWLRFRLVEKNRPTEGRGFSTSRSG